MASRPAGEWFQPVAGATANRKQIRISYYNRSRDDSSDRTLSPQRLVHYRDNWYLDAWCHLREDLRTFALDSIVSVKTLDKPAKAIGNSELNEHYSSAYGIFSGKAGSKAVLLFDAERARWVSKEQWHPEQQGEWSDDGNYQLTVPYNNPTELVMDILRHGRHVEVLEPEGLRQQVRAEIGRMSEIYS
jgi:predicted DNA-binding transcriptional regulator YafY